MSLAAEDLKVGSVVRLICGSPKMIVTGLTPVNRPSGANVSTLVSLLWISARGEPQRMTGIDAAFLCWPKPYPAPAAEEEAE